MTFKHTAGLLRYQGFQEKMKKANKGLEEKTKARESSIHKFHNFFISTGPLGMYSLFTGLIFLEFQGH